MNKITRAELAFVFSQLYENYFAMIPQKYLDEVQKDIDEETFNKFDPEKPFTMQNLSDETLEILATIFKDKF